MSFFNIMAMFDEPFVTEWENYVYEAQTKGLYAPLKK